jgi:hypothetical protein
LNFRKTIRDRFPAAVLFADSTDEIGTFTGHRHIVALTGICCGEKAHAKMAARSQRTTRVAVIESLPIDKKDEASFSFAVTISNIL